MSNKSGAGNILIVSAPSGTGKTTLCRRLVERQAPAIRYSISHTTREPRGRERPGVDYYFVDDTEFDRMIAAHELAEWAAIHQHRYGTSVREIERATADGVDLLLDIEGQGAVQIKKRFPQAILIFILPPNLDVLAERLRRRGTESAEEIKRRLANAQEELNFIQHYEFVVVNDRLEEAVDLLEAIVLAGRQRRERQADAIGRFAIAQKGTG